MTTFFFALRTYKRLGKFTIIFLAVGTFLLSVSLNAVGAVITEKSKDFEMEVIGENLSPSMLNKIKDMDDIIKSTLVIELHGTIKVGENNLFTDIYAIDGNYLDDEFEMGNSFERGMAMPYLVMNNTASKSFTDENGIFVDKDKIKWTQSSFVMVLDGEKEITARVCGILKPEKWELEKEQEDGVGASNDNNDIISRENRDYADEKRTYTVTTKSTNITNKKGKITNNTREKNNADKKEESKQKTTLNNNNEKVPLGNESSPPDVVGNDASTFTVGNKGSKVFMDIETVGNVLPLRQGDYSKVLIKIKNFGSQQKVAQELEALGLTTVNTDMAIQKEWETKTSLAIYMGIAGLMTMISGLVLIYKNSEKDLTLNRNNYKGLYYCGFTGEELIKVLLERAGIVIMMGIVLGVISNGILPFFLMEKYKLSSIYAYPIMTYTILILAFLCVFILMFLYFAYKKKMKSFWN